MDTLTEEKWDVIISGTDLQRSLIVLALSRSKKKILHIDPNTYYGGSDAAFSLEEMNRWVDEHKGSGNATFRNASQWKTSIPIDQAKLSPSRSYTLTLSPFIIYSKSKLLSILISSNAYRQLEFQAVGNWWITDATSGTWSLKKIPNGREDIFQDTTIDNRSKRQLMKFLRFVIDYENQTNIWKPFAKKPLCEFLSSQFSMPLNLQKIIGGLTLSLDTADQTKVSWALPRIQRHLNSIGALGPGFGAVISKWGCGAEISQLACRAGAVGGCIYILGTGIERYDLVNKDPEGFIEVKLSNGYVVKTKNIVTTPEKSSDEILQPVSRMIAVSTSSFQNLIKSDIEGAPPPAVFVVVFPPESSKDKSNNTHPYPIYIMVHSSDTGECPEGQYVIYATTLTSPKSKDILEVSVEKLFTFADDNKGKLLYSVYYEFSSTKEEVYTQRDTLGKQPIDLTFDDQIIDDAELEWQKVIGHEKEFESFMKFDDKDLDDELDSD